MMLLAKAQKRNWRWYRFICDTIDDMTEAAARVGSPEHFTTDEIIRCCVSNALFDFGMMAEVVFRRWGIEESEEIDDMVIGMIECEILEGTPEDVRGNFTVDMISMLRSHHVDYGLGR